MDDIFKISHSDDIWYGRFPQLNRAGFINACSCRLGGESAVVADGLNLALHVGDDPVLVNANRRRFADALGVDCERFTTCEQVHGSKVVAVTADMVGAGAHDLQDTIKDTDALITNLPDVPLLLFFADCTPVLLADPVTGAIGIAHAGWRGTVAEIAAKAVQAMAANYGCRPEDLYAAIGPSIGCCCYEVDDAVRNQAGGYEEFFTPVEGRKGHYRLDLWGYNTRVLEQAGVLPERILLAGVCTDHNRELFFSYRAEKGRTGRMGVCLCRSTRSSL